MSNSSLSSFAGGAGCPAPFLSQDDYPYAGGSLAGRFCGDVASGFECCLPCPATQWVYSDAMRRNTDVAMWFNVPALVGQVFLLLTFVLLPEQYSHRSYLSVGLCASLIVLELAFIVPLGTKPDLCFDAVTPHDMHTSMSCAWTGAFLITGAMGAAVWIMLRSLWTHLRVCWDVKRDTVLFWIAQVLGIGLPALFLAIAIPVSGVSYRFGPTCVVNQKHSLVVWFGWLIAFAGLAAVIQILTTAFCFWVYLRDVIHGGYRSSSGLASKSSASPTKPMFSPSSATDGSERRMAWRRVRRILQLQWRSMVLTALVIVVAVYFSVVFVRETTRNTTSLSPGATQGLTRWATCLVLNRGDKKKCGVLGHILGLSEGGIVAAWFMAAILGISTFALMIRRSMLVGWWRLIRHPRAFRHPSLGEEDFIIISPKRKSFSRRLESEKGTEEDGDIPPVPEMPGNLRVPKKGVALSPTAASPVSPLSPISPVSIGPGQVQAGDATERHETTNWFDEEEQERLEQERRESRLDDVV